MKIKALFCALPLLVACETPGDRGPDSPYFQYPGGSRLILTRPLEIPADWATVRLQFGRTVAFGHVQEQQPHCILEINTVRPVPQGVEPDNFTITRVQRSMSEIAAASGFFIRSAMAEDDRPTQMFYKIQFSLRSERQPGVLRLTCQHDQHAAGIGIPRHLTLTEIRQALGDIFKLELPQT